METKFLKKSLRSKLKCLYITLKVLPCISDQPKDSMRLFEINIFLHNWNLQLSKVYKSCKCSQIVCSRVHYYSMFPRLFISISNFLNC